MARIIKEKAARTLVRRIGQLDRDFSACAATCARHRKSLPNASVGPAVNARPAVEYHCLDKSIRSTIATFRSFSTTMSAYSGRNREQVGGDYSCKTHAQGKYPEYIAFE